MTCVCCCVTGDLSISRQEHLHDFPEAKHSHSAVHRGRSALGGVCGQDVMLAATVCAMCISRTDQRHVLAAKMQRTECK